MVYSKFAGTELEVEGEDHLLLKVRGTMGVGGQAAPMRSHLSVFNL